MCGASVQLSPAVPPLSSWPHPSFRSCQSWAAMPSCQALAGETSIMTPTRTHPYDKQSLDTGSAIHARHHNGRHSLQTHQRMPLSRHEHFQAPGACTRYGHGAFTIAAHFSQSMSPSKHLVPCNVHGHAGVTIVTGVRSCAHPQHVSNGVPTMPGQVSQLLFLAADP